MAATNKKITGNNSKFVINVAWEFIPGTPSISSFTATNDRTSVTVAATVTKPSSGNFKVSNIWGWRTDSYTSYESSGCSVKITANNKNTTRTGCGVYFNARNSAHKWSNVACTLTGVQATATGQKINIQVTKSSVTSVNQKYFASTLNFETTQSIEYSKDNSTWQSSGTFDNLTPNTTYTFYVRSRSTSATSNNSGYVYDSVEGTTIGTPPSYNMTAGSISRTGFTLTPSNITYDTGASFTSLKFEWGTTTSYGSSYTNSTSASAYSITGLSANTLYYWKTTLTDSYGLSTVKTGSTTTSGNAPTVTASTTPARTSCTLAIGATYDTNASFSSGKYEYGTSTSYGTTVTISGTGNQTISNLSPNTTYYYKVSITDNKSRTGTKTGSFKTTCNAPSNVTISRTSSTTSTIVVSVSATGDTNAPITGYKVYYKLASASSYTEVNLGTSTSTTISSLSTDTNYNFYVAATNAGGTTSSSVVTYSTLLNSPTISAVTASSITVNSCIITATASISPSRTLNYRFSKDGGTTWTAYQSSNSYSWTDLTESTTYSMYVQVKAIHIGTNASDTTASNSTSVTTLSGQAKMFVKVNGAWKNGPAYIKVGGVWKEAKTVYVKVNGAWKEQV